MAPPWTLVLRGTTAKSGSIIWSSQLKSVEAEHSNTAAHCMQPQDTFIIVNIPKYMKPVIMEVTAIQFYQNYMESENGFCLKQVMETSNPHLERTRGLLRRIPVTDFLSMPLGWLLWLLWSSCMFLGCYFCCCFFPILSQLNFNCFLFLVILCCLPVGHITFTCLLSLRYKAPLLKTSELPSNNGSPPLIPSWVPL